MGSLQRDLAPLTEEAWAAIDGEAARALRHFLAGRKLVEFDGPKGWTYSAVSLGRVDRIEGPVEGVEAGVRQVLPMVELRTAFSVPRGELDDIGRGRANPDLSAVTEAARLAAAAEDRMVFHGFKAGGVDGMAGASPHQPLPIGDDYAEYPKTVARAVAVLKAAGVDGPFAVALGPRCYTGVIETTEEGGFPVMEHIRMVAGGPVIWAPAVDGAVVLSMQGGDFSLTCGQDFAVGSTRHGPSSVELFIEESVCFRVVTPEAAVALIYG
jgi:uncharacterized linocin/CFP29 family protein